jgi:hypothetical protein
MIRMSRKLLRPFLGAAVAAVLTASAAHAQALSANQTAGFGNNKLLTFTYGQNYDCVDQPGEDLNFNGILMQSDPGEFQMPICQVATEPTIDPTGGPIKKTAHIYVLIPMFSVDNDQTASDALPCPAGVRSSTVCGAPLGAFLISKFGFVPEGFKTHPLVATQCPDPGSLPGTCTTHTSSLDLAPALAALHIIPSPATANIFVPTPNHSHIIDNDLINHKHPIWWEVRPVLVMDQADWPAADASSGITSEKEMDAAEKAGNAIEVPSNFFLFFGSMKGMKM